MSFTSEGEVREREARFVPYNSTLLNRDGSSSSLQSSSTVEEFIAAVQQIVARNDSSDRSEENVSTILTSKIELIFNNCTNQDLLQALGEFFMWMIPNTESLTSAEREAEAEERERGREICSRKELEDLFVRDLLPFAESSDAIYSLCRSVARIALKPNNTNFVTADAREELLKLVKNAPCEKSLQWALQAIYNLADAKKDGVPIKSNPFVCDEVSTIAYKLFCDSTVPKIVERAADLLFIQVELSTPQFCSTDPDFARKMLRKLDEATKTESICSIAKLIVRILCQKQCNRAYFASDEAARVFLSKLNSSDDPQVLRLACVCISNIGCCGDNISHGFASPEMCRSIFKCFSKQNAEIFKCYVLRPIAVLSLVLPRARSTFAQECPGLAQIITEMLLSASDDETRRNVAIAVTNLSIDDTESAKRLFNNVALYEALIHAASHVRDEAAKNSLILAMHNATNNWTDFLPLCAARCPFYDERQIELLKIDSLDSLVSNLNNNGWEFDAPQNAAFFQLRSILIVIEKFGQFLEVLDQRIEEGDDKIDRMLMTIAEGFALVVQTCWAPYLGDPFVDVTLSLIERSSGAASVVFVHVLCAVVTKNTLLTVYPSTVLRVLQKLDNSKELRDREDSGLQLEFSTYKFLQIALHRSPESFGNNNFLVDNSALIRSCFERSLRIHQFDANSAEKSL